MRQSLRFSVRIGLVLVLSAAPLLGQRTIQSDEQLIAALDGADQKARERSVAYVRESIAQALRSPALESALVKELTRLNEFRRQRRERERAGQPLTTDFPAEYYAEVIQLVGESSSPGAINALAGALGTGSMAEDGLAKFGDAAVPSLAAVARAKVGLVTTGSPGDTPPDIVASAITTLEKMSRASKPLAASSRSTIVRIAQERLSGRQDGFVVLAACRLAVATGEPGLRQRVGQLAADQQEIRRLGVTEAWVQQVQKAAQTAAARK